MTLVTFPPILTIPAVTLWPDIEKRFAKAREIASDHERGKHLVIVTTRRSYMLVGCPGPETFNAQAIQTVERQIPSTTPLFITVIANNDPEAIQRDVRQVIPFAAYLLTLVHLGHYVTLFEGHSSSLVAAVRGADLLLVDGAIAPSLQPNWMNTAKAVMRRRWIMQFSRDGKLTDLFRR